MTSRMGSRERGLWIGTVAVLATSLAWTSALELAWLAHAAVDHSAAVRAVARAMAHIVWSGLGPGPVALAGAATLLSVALLVRAVAGGTAAPEEWRHA